MSDTLSPLQKETFLRVVRATRDAPDAWVRAEGSGERVTLVSLWARGLLVRRAWRGTEGHPDAAHEYRISPVVSESLAADKGKESPTAS